MPPACVPLTDRLIFLVAMLTAPRLVALALEAYGTDGRDGPEDGR